MTTSLPPSSGSRFESFADHASGKAGSPPPSSAGAPPPPIPPIGGGDRSRMGALWVTATGAFLLLAAAAVFVAVRWQQLGGEVKLAILGAMTGGFLLAGRRYRDALPATSGVLYHLGAFLVPLNTAAVAFSRDVAWEPFLLLEGVSATAAWFVLNRIERSKVLDRATAAAVVVALAGTSATVAASTSIMIPTAVLLAAAAAIAELNRRHHAAIGWSMLAGLAPCFALVERTMSLGTDVLTTLGLAGSTPRLTTLISGTVAAGVLGRNAARRHDLVLVVCAALAAALGLTTAWVGLAPATTTTVLGLASVFLVIELAAHAVRHDEFWSEPARWLAGLAELIALGLCLPAARYAAVRMLDGPIALAVPQMGAGILSAVAWFVADLRRRSADGSGSLVALLVGGGSLPATIGMTLSVVFGVAAATGSVEALALSAVGVAALLVLSGRPGGHALTAGLTIGAPLLVPSPIVAALVGIGGALALAGSAVTRARMPQRDVNAMVAWALAGAALLPILETRSLLDHRVDGLVLTVGALIALWVVGALLDLGEDHPGASLLDGGHPDVRHLAMTARIGALVVLATTVSLALNQIAIAAGLAAALAVLDAVRRDDATPLFTLSGSAPILVMVTAYSVTGRIDQAGLALCVLAAVVLGVQLLLSRRFTPPLTLLMGVSAIVGFVATVTAPASFASALIVLGAVGIAASTAYRRPEGLIFAWTLVTFGVWSHLGIGQVTALDAYVAPVALALLVVGLRSPRISSWVAFGPATVLLGGAALVERISGGGGIHALVAGTVGVIAVLAGGGRRLIGPLLLGTALLVTLTAHESLGVSRQVPTWGWLAAGGVLLLAAGVFMDRRETGPIETGRRVIDVVHEQFT